MAPRFLISDATANLLGAVALLATLLFPPMFATAASAQKMDLYAVIVGINKYKDTSNNLELAAKDAKTYTPF